MKALTVKIMHIFLAVLLVISTMGVTVEKHYCMGRLKSVAIFQELQRCSGDMPDSKMPCCKDVREELKVEDLNSFNFDFKLFPQDFQLAFDPYPKYTEDEGLATYRTLPIVLESPPPLATNLTVAYQVFLI